MLISIILLVVFVILLCAVEIPKMMKQKLFKEIWVFSIVMAVVTFFAFLKIIDSPIPNPSDLVLAMFSPIIEPLKQFMK